MKTLSLVGKGPGWERAFKDYRDGREIWCVSTVFAELQTVEVQPSRIFQLHERKLFESWIGQEQHRVVLMKGDPEFDCAAVLPADRLLSLFGARFGASMVWMLGLALVEGYEDIRLRGVHNNHMTEYGGQRDTLNWFIGLAQGKGVKIHIDEDCGMFIANQAYELKEPQNG